MLSRYSARSLLFPFPPLPPPPSPTPLLLLSLLSLLPLLLLSLLLLSLLLSSSPSAHSPAAATAVDAYLAASRPKSKPLTTKQRLGKILGLKKAGGGRWTK